MQKMQAGQQDGFGKPMKGKDDNRSGKRMDGGQRDGCNKGNKGGMSRNGGGMMQPGNFMGGMQNGRGMQQMQPGNFMGGMPYGYGMQQMQPGNFMGGMPYNGGMMQPNFMGGMQNGHGMQQMQPGNFMGGMQNGRGMQQMQPGNFMGDQRHGGMKHHGFKDEQQQKDLKLDVSKVKTLMDAHLIRQGTYDELHVGEITKGEDNTFNVSILDADNKVVKTLQISGATGRPVKSNKDAGNKTADPKAAMGQQPAPVSGGSQI
ncbi:MAG: hypothetical protein R3E93_11870 [Thiothrix sp.]